MAEVFWAIVREEEGDRKKAYTKARISEASLSRALDGYVPGPQVVERVCVAYPAHAPQLLTLWRVERMREAAQEVEDLAAALGAALLTPRPVGPPADPDPQDLVAEALRRARLAAKGPAAEDALALVLDAVARRPESLDAMEATARLVLGLPGREKGG